MDTSVVITEVEEFCRSLRPTEDAAERENQRLESAEQGGDQIHEVNESGKSGIDDEVINKEPLFKEVAVGKGLAGALKLLQEQGDLKRSVESAGRKTDKKPIFDNINLEYRDEYGRSMTPKEAFRAQSHIFHGVKPGKAKQEKRMRLREAELKRKQMDTSVSSYTNLHDYRHVTKRMKQ